MTSRPSESPTPDARRKRILYRAWHRGTRELDMLIGRFAAAKIEGMDDTALDGLEALMEAPEPMIMEWVTGRAEPPAGIDHSLVEQLRVFHAAHPVARD
ncbi:MAG: succinate dehydrogenase assembly factor 2 [Flavobacteriaceae bacterium]